METTGEGARPRRPLSPATRERERERERKKLALSLHRVYMLAHTASNRVRALHSFLVHANLITHIPPTQKTDSLRTLDKKRRILDDADLVGDFNGVAVLGESAVRLLVTVRANEGVDLHALNVVHALDRFLDLLLVRAAPTMKTSVLLDSIFANAFHSRAGASRSVRRDTHGGNTSSVTVRLAVFSRHRPRRHLPRRASDPPLSRRAKNPKRASRAHRKRTCQRSSFALDGTETRG